MLYDLCFASTATFNKVKSESRVAALLFYILQLTLMTALSSFACMRDRQRQVKSDKRAVRSGLS